LLHDDEDGDAAAEIERCRVTRLHCATDRTKQNEAGGLSH
jgi:hypothetical protein